MFSLAGKSIVVTGGGRGIGFGIARAMCVAGGRVLITGRDRAGLARAAKAITADGGDIAHFAADITDRAAPEAIVAEARARFGRLDAWVNNAGGASQADSGPMLETGPEAWDRVMDVNLRAVFFAAQAAARAMKHGGSIINIGSRSGSQPCPLSGPYGAAKAAVESLTATMATEWGHLDIRVNAVAPGVILTESMAGLIDGPAQVRQVETIPLRRLGTPDDVAALCVFLASDEARYVTGTVIPVTGGSRIPISTLSYFRGIARAERTPRITPNR